MLHDQPPRESGLPVPQPVRTAAEWSWRLLAIAGAATVVLLVVARLQLVMLAVFVALLACALLYPLLQWLRARGLGAAWATTITLIVALLVIGGALGFVIGQIVGNYEELEDEVRAGYEEVRDWLRDGPLGLSDAQISEYLTNAWNTIRENSDGIASGAFRTASTALEVVSGAAIAFFATIFFLYDGPSIWRWCVGLFPRPAQPDIEASGRLSWATLTGYIRGIVIIALADAIGIGIVLAVLQVPLALPLTMLVFFGAFVPIIGAFVAGAVAVLVALASQGLGAAVIVFVAIIVVQQVEGHVLHPLVMNRQVQLHPLAIVLVVAAGSLVAGLVGAVVAVPIAAVVNVVGKYFAARYRERAEAVPVPHAEPASEVEAAPDAGRLAD
ncbi:MAG: AI-2E family transporter [Candidatus Nanopelagicales bacterium]